MKDIMSLDYDEKVKVYEEVETKRQSGSTVRSKEDESGFPAIRLRIDGKDAYLTDCLSVEKWWRRRNGLRHFIVTGSNLRFGFGESAKTKAEALERATKAARKQGLIGRDEQIVDPAIEEEAD